MVNFIVSAVSLLAAAQFASAVPAEYEVRSVATPTFSFESWADSVAKDPEGSHPIPDGVLSVRFAGREKSKLGKRGVVCNTVKNTFASVQDSVACINFLASKSQKMCSVAAGGSSSFCKIGLSEIVGVSGKPPSEGGTSSKCGDVARAAGRIMDVCTRGNTVQGENTAFGNGFLAVHIRRP
ncbi:hypothetical protein PT974_10773 [Cladobotryum mycophilum]|uniref:Uncharacterized protein n=1 Tax=Cladobotryum mycophilum TaxID=491253 RepID=A0ABR0SAR9_9HYPO